MDFSEILETVMLICFGASWPFNLWKAAKSRTAKSTSLPFLLLIWSGYVAGIAAKLLKLCNPALPNPTWYLMLAYGVNLLMLTACIAVYFRNRRLDRGQTKESPRG